MADTMASELQPNLCLTRLDNNNPNPNVDKTSPPELPAVNLTRDNSKNQGSASSAAFKEHETLKSGYAEKRYRTRKSWKTRWLVIRSHFLSVYKNEKEYELLYRIDLYNTSAISEVNKKKAKHVFGICTPEKLFYFKCSNDSDRGDWLRALRDARDSDPIVPFEKLAPSNPVPIDMVMSSDCQNISSGSSSSHNSDVPNSPNPGDILSDSSDENALSDLPMSRSNSYSPHKDLNSEHPDSGQKAPVPPELGSKVFMQGVLFKHCVGYKAWRSRWFVLRDSQLCYYKNDKEYELQGMVPRTDILDVKLATSTSKSKLFCFKVMTAQRAYKLAAPTSEERDSWIESLRPQQA